MIQENIHSYVKEDSDMITREELYALVWSKPMTKVAEQFEVSGSYMARVCSDLRVPRPARGYWAKMAVGKAPKQVPLPDALPGDPVVWSKDDDQRVPRTQLTTEPPKLQNKNGVQRVRGLHGLIIGAKKHFEIGYPVKDDGYLKPYKKLLVDINASKKGLDKALSLSNQLFKSLHSAGHRVVIAPQSEEFRRHEVDKYEVPRKRERYEYDYPRLWSPCRPTVVYIGNVAIGLAVIEMSEEVQMRYVNGEYVRESDYVSPRSRFQIDHSWTTTKYLPCGRFRLMAYSPYREVSWSMSWQEARKASLTHKIPIIVKEIEIAAKELIEKLKEAERQAKIRRREWEVIEERRRKEEDRRRIQESNQESKIHLRQIIQAWGEIINIELFLQGVENRSSELPEEERDGVLERLKLAREFIGSQNPLDLFRSWKTPRERYTPLSACSETNQVRDNSLSPDIL